MTGSSLNILDLANLVKPVEIRDDATPEDIESVIQTAFEHVNEFVFNFRLLKVIPNNGGRGLFLMPVLSTTKVDLRTWTRYLCPCCSSSRISLIVFGQCVVWLDSQECRACFQKIGFYFACGRQFKYYSARD